MVRKSAFLAALLLASYVGQVYSITCYVCVDSKESSNRACRDNPEQMVPIDCDAGSHVLKDVPEFNKADNKNKFKCMTVEAKNSTNTIFLRSCLPTYLSCDSLGTDSMFPRNGKFERCTLCVGDKCNASSKAGIALFVQIFCLVLSGMPSLSNIFL